MDIEAEPSLRSIVNHESLKWIFVGGKGGVGKTTTSSSISIQLALHNPNKKYLLISTDPAHNLSDAFNQKFGKDARQVEGLPNLSCMEIDPDSTLENLQKNNESTFGSAGGNDPLKSMMGDITGSIPGIDEAFSFMEVLKHIGETKENQIKYDTVIFDTAPTGHTLRFLQLPSTLEKLLGKVNELSGRFGPMLNNLLGSQGGQSIDFASKIKEIQVQVTEVNKQFQDPELTTFVCVCISEFLSLYETERLIQELMSYNMDVNSIVINQLLFSDDSECRRCNARWRMQKKYLDQMDELYEDYHLVKMPLLAMEVRGLENLKKFSKYLIEPYNSETDGHVVFDLEEQ
ncbi:ATPase GET3 [Komagataella phaffii CBS 7435]|uniref:ATPase GET3 n=2 Tax=Komagataella phaffii TaxID=460519 RepID=GET3_KOMPG|nr:Guanine nucleotide exchange factor for Gpa1p [Komagataella phaffii GS115]C4R7S9.1 RecName: Full=ATPase GET3; AltName: Full=Arsenical pump-driving ATPase; AltName: Full=Arsenite-stimulated ATPase; AltName: Full=Golgi to ER traffic protein 3; AltName: Full=Guided entry of tail-anchored proteins 3 [Komagataella phaffii GS115]AOA65232.1 GQ67_04756T0 [Komagataella phaffii]KAI0463095.1 Golgi to ER traffic- protein [Komagataella kurtzmanii]CAH2450962.1 ATPase GET3 [Komagataella phaffii CBS 7435]AO